MSSWLDNWCEKFSNSPKEQMSEEVTACFSGLLIRELAKDEVPESIKDDSFQAIYNRAKFVLGLEPNAHVIIFIIYMAPNIGSIIMYLTYCRYKTIKLDLSILTELFPYGFLTEPALEELWRMQKQENKNLVDTLTSKSFEIR